ncbi:uncharacterized protein SPAPADRAFT_53121 [Spathaspora passalidarum NRRL Y-27907]|uniref:Uncharacterized protein n=1 Tax=Spathaspora passalidarum (strain NRRL Y-27907 / 11-Y1) TaxID=619300 RepID=G3ADW7_SPAPN|nr:uncharacterized protein SPAPADRAFT_53121 [Spathaspora passalidarum NRRL Y-27907]EGW34691.1 hypothetical protein SPAPADRAFT_53121 [Spathaspora passalidarum NRRL Y-27907]
MNSVILASTGERVHRTITLSQSTLPRETDPLLGEAGPRNRYQWVTEHMLKPIRNIYFDPIFRSVLKCCIAYFISSLGVYYTPFDDFLGTTDSKHVVATVVVYFHPTRSKGSMLQALTFVLLSVGFSFAVSLACRSVAAEIFQLGAEGFGTLLDLSVSSIALGIVAFMKHKVNKLTFNTACSLACISIIACIIKEGSMNSEMVPLNRIESIFRVVLSGCMISVACCYLIWPVSAINKLQSALNDSYNIFASVLSILGKRFVSGEQISAKDSEMIEKLKSNINSLLQNLEEAEYELRLLGREQEFRLFKEMVDSTISLARHLQALSAATKMQWNLLHEPVDAGTDIISNDDSLDPTDSVDLLDTVTPTPPDTSSNEIHTSAQLFDLFVYYLSPSIKSLVFTIRGVLAEVPFEKYNEEYPGQFAKTTTLQHSLESAIHLYEDKQNESLQRLYDQPIFKQNSNSVFIADQEEVAACCGNYSYLLSQFALQLLEFLKLSEKYEDAKASPREWPWLRWHGWEPRGSATDELLDQGNSLHAALDDLRDEFGTNQYRDPTRSSVANHDFGYKIWNSLKVFRRTDVQFGIRVGLGAAFLSLFAYLDATKDIFITWRGEWALTIYCIMMNKSVGGTAMTVKYRIIGTFVGCYTALAVWALTDANVYALALTGFLISIPSFYFILYWKVNGAFGRFLLLAYNLTALYSYSMLQKDSEDDREGGENPLIEEIAFHRFVAVSVGIVWAMTMATLFLPNSARARLKRGLTVLWLRLGVIWNSDPLEYNPQTMKLVGFKAEEGTNSLLAECEVLLKQAPLEYRLKGSFPTSKYSRLIRDTSAILDAFQNLDLFIKVDPTLSENEKYVLKYIEFERNEVEHRIFLVFYMLASAMRLGFPVPGKPASIEHAKDRMLYKLNQIRNKSILDDDMNLKNTDFILLYSYILVASTIAQRLDSILIQIKELLGEIAEEKFVLV